MRIYNSNGDLDFKLTSFPDGQPHLILEPRSLGEVTIESAITNPSELFDVQLAANVLAPRAFKLTLAIRYLMAARMDRPIDANQPFTLEVVAKVINAMNVDEVKILDVHSPVALTLIERSKNILPIRFVDDLCRRLWDPVIVCPDQGAESRVAYLADTYDVLWCKKSRDVNTGRLSPAVVPETPKVGGRPCVIVDDICDGGRTFTNIAHVLRERGAVSVSLFVTHGIFSAGLPLAGIDGVYTTDSFPTVRIEGEIKKIYPSRGFADDV